MSRRDGRVPLQHMLDHGREALELIDGRDKGEVLADRVLVLALVRLLEVVGEAANRVPAEIQRQHGHIPWGPVVSMRNRLIHGYDSVDLDILWRILTDDLPALVRDLQKALHQLGEDDASTSGGQGRP